MGIDKESGSPPSEEIENESQGQIEGAEDEKRVTSRYLDKDATLMTVVQLDLSDDSAAPATFADTSRPDIHLERSDTSPDYKPLFDVHELSVVGITGLEEGNEVSLYETLFEPVEAGGLDRAVSAQPYVSM
ncbi:hypothetical protein FA13DRAFT_1722230 [Coprinellus micaceus]|uniref:Uncharacterized protein n=1 Tax=Coprinellus micaceus TaxID=71717 RepID=A0A4Y7RNI2_COPMI|nr:hypothetical protein FA13DRAFT_1722230 [Coprinellus micaceus]